MSIIPSVGSAQQIKLKYLFGLNSQIKNNLYFLDEEKILYPAGYHAVIQDLKDNTQSFLSGLIDYTGISCMSLSPQRKKLALGLTGNKEDKDEKIGQPAIEIYDVMTHQRKKPALVFQEVPIHKWVSIAFATQMQENKYLVSLSGGEGEVVLVYWYWEKGQVLCYQKLGSIMALEVQMNYQDPNIVSIVGKKVYKCYKKYEPTEDNKNHVFNSICQQMNGAPQDLHQDFTSHQWLSVENFLVCSTMEGSIIICNEKAEYQCTLKDSPNALEKQKQVDIYVITPYTKGFIVGASNLKIYVYKSNNDDRNPFDCIYQLKIKTQIDSQIQANEQIAGLAINPHLEDKIICTLTNNTIYQVRMKKENEYADHEQLSQQIGLSYHHGGINAMDLCIRKPLIATCGKDNTIKIWNYEEKTLELNWNLNSNEEPLALAFHPSGYHIVVAFQDKLRFMSINIHQQSKMDKNRHYKEISQFKNCKEIKFSNGGQYFAAVNGTSNAQVIHVYKFYTGENPSHLIMKAHLQKIRGLCWSKDDTVLASCGTDGQVYAWKIDNDLKHDQTAMRIVDSHQKSVQFSSIVMTQGCGGGHNEKEEQKIIVSGNDKNLYDVDMGAVTSTQANMTRYPVDYNIQSLAFPSTNKVLFGGIQDEFRSSGAIRCYLYPFVNGKCTDYQAHDERGVEKIKVTHNDKWLITAGKDGCIMLFEIKDKDARGHKLAQGYTKYSQEILVTRGDLDDLKHRKEDQNTKLLEVSTTNPLNSKEEEDQVKELKEQLAQSKRQQESEYNNTEEQKKEAEKKYTDEYNRLQEMNNKEMEELESEMNNKQMQELEKYENAKRLHNLQINKNNTKKSNILLDQEKEAQQQEMDFKRKLEELRNWSEKIENDIKKKKQEQDESLNQIEEETNKEIEDLKDKNTNEHQSISEQGLRAKTEVSFTNKKINQQLQDMQELEDQRKIYEEEKAELEKKKEELHKESQKQKATIVERDRQIGEKERKIYELKKRSQELEKFKFVLDHKIKELKRDIAPREEEIQRMKVETNRLDGKLKDFNVFYNILGTIVDELDQTQELMKQDITKLRQRIQVQKSKIKNFKNQVYATVQHILNYEDLKQSVVSLKECHSKDFVKSVEIDKDITDEYQSQKKYLEKTVQMLKKNLQKDNEIHKQDNIRIIRENVELIKEINKLRGDIRNAKFSEKGGSQKMNYGKNQKSNNASQIHFDGEDKQEKQQIVQEMKVEIEQLQENLSRLQQEAEYIQQQNQ